MQLQRAVLILAFSAGICAASLVDALVAKSPHSIVIALAATITLLILIRKNI
jgi:hypothetical protein